MILFILDEIFILAKFLFFFYLNLYLFYLDIY